jgi:hypothetical protein
LIVDEREIAELMNDHFIESVSSLRDKLKPSLFEINTLSVDKSIVLDDTGEEEVRLTIDSLKKSSPGFDGLSVDMIKCLKDNLSPVLTHLINRVFATGVYPDCFKTALVIPINKSGNTTSIDDYRPISMLSILNKILERILLTRLQNFTHDHLNLIFCRQYGFRPKCNTEIAATELVQHIQQAIDQKLKASMVSMDLQKAFDMVDIPKLINALSQAGIRGNTLKLIYSYLTQRKQIVKVGDKFSTPITFSQGVVQGSILGPWLFTIFINSISNLQLCGKLFLYADDCILLNTHEQHEEIKTKICSDMKIIINYFCHQSLILNPSKTNFVVFHSPSSKNNEPSEILIESSNEDTVKIAGQYLIKRVDRVKYLGLILDSQLKWDHHIKNIESKISSAAGVLWKLKSQLPTSTKKAIYTALIESHLNYLTPVWGSASESALKTLQVIQNRALRNVFCLDRLQNRVDMYQHLVDNFLPIRALFFVNTAAFVFNCLKKNYHNNLNFSFTIPKSSRTRKYIKPQKSRTQYGSKSISSIGPKIFNDLSDHIQKSRHIHSFKRELKTFAREESFLDTCFNGQFITKYL